MQLLTRKEELFLLTVWMLGDNAYGVSVAEKLTKVTGKNWIMGQVYVPLERLEQKGYLTSFLSEPVSERGGRSKRLYSLTESGLKALLATRSMEEYLWKEVSIDSIEESLIRKR